MQLVIAEKHSVGSSIAKVLGVNNQNDGYIEGNGYIVTWCVGHLVKLSKPDIYGKQYENYWTFDNLPIIPTNWKFEVDITKTKSKQYNVVKMLMNDSRVDEIVCATDAGREGECIFRYVYNNIGCRKPVKRLWISSMEDSAIRSGMNNLQPDSDFDNMFAAGLARSKADWLVGMNCSRLFSNRYSTSLSIGRVRTPVLEMVVKRDYDIEHFVKQKYFTVEMNCGDFIATTARIDDESFAKNLAEICNGKSAVVTEVTKEIKTINPPKLYDLTTLQREANRLFGYTAKQTLDYTQTLYEAKLVTYPRTDSQYLTEDMEQTAADMINCIKNTFPELSTGITFDDETAVGIKRCLDNSKVSDHTAIIPTSEIKKANLNALPTGEKNILLLISAKLLIATSEPYKYESVKVSVTSESATSTEFNAAGTTRLSVSDFKMIENHTKEVLTGKKSEEKEKNLPELSEGQYFENVSAKTSEHFTAPPKEYTEDTLLKAMETAGNADYDENADVEKKGLGTPATRADIIEKLVKDKYIERDKKKIIAGEKGKTLISVVPDEIKSAKLTADWETTLQNIEKGKSSAETFLRDIEAFVSGLVKQYGNKAADNNFSSDKEVLGKCPRCGRNVYEGKANYYCESGKDGCGFTIWKKNKYPEADISVDTVKKFLSDGKAELSTVNKAGERYSGTFEMKDDGKYVKFQYCKAERQSIGKCPICGKPVYENSKAYSCGDRNCDFVIWKSICSKTISESQAKKLLENGKSDLIKGFKKKSGDTFEAYLVLKVDYSVGFDFSK